MKQLMKRKLSVLQVIMFVLAIIWAIITLYPLYITILSSLKDNEEIFGKMFSLPSKFVWRNYYDSLFEANILLGIGNSLFLAGITTIIVLFCAVLASYILARGTHPVTKVIYYAFIVGVMLPIHTTIIPISKTAATLRGTNTFWFLLLVYSTFQLPQAIFLITGYMKGINKELEESATIDGCNRMSTLFLILVPVCTPILSTVAILVFVYGYSELIFSIILLYSPQKYPISRALMYFTGDYSVRMGPVFSSIVVAIIPMIIIYLLFHERVQRGILAGAIKG